GNFFSLTILRRHRLIIASLSNDLDVCPSVRRKLLPNLIFSHWFVTRNEDRAPGLLNRRNHQTRRCSKQDSTRGNRPRESSIHDRPPGQLSVQPPLSWEQSTVFLRQI